jgi:hypothetical protein
VDDQLIEELDEPHPYSVSRSVLVEIPALATANRSTRSRVPHQLVARLMFPRSRYMAVTPPFNFLLVIRTQARSTRPTTSPTNTDAQLERCGQKVEHAARGDAASDLGEVRMVGHHQRLHRSQPDSALPTRSTGVPEYQRRSDDPRSSALWSPADDCEEFAGAFASASTAIGGPAGRVAVGRSVHGAGDVVVETRLESLVPGWRHVSALGRRSSGGHVGAGHRGRRSGRPQACS